MSLIVRSLPLGRNDEEKIARIGCILEARGDVGDCNPKNFIRRKRASRNPT